MNSVGKQRAVFVLTGGKRKQREKSLLITRSAAGDVSLCVPGDKPGSLCCYEGGARPEPLGLGEATTRVALLQDGQ